jgi:hypothetical protein
MHGLFRLFTLKPERFNDLTVLPRFRRDSLLTCHPLFSAIPIDCIIPVLHPSPWPSPDLLAGSAYYLRNVKGSLSLQPVNLLASFWEAYTTGIRKISHLVLRQLSLQQ